MPGVEHGTLMQVIQVEQDAMGLLGWLIIGLIAGWLAGRISKGRGFGILGNLVVGMLGAVMGGLMFRLLGVAAYGFVGSLVMATVGALFLLYLVRVLKSA